MSNNPPEVIYLQWDSDPEIESTWCVDRINDDDVCYVKSTTAGNKIKEKNNEISRLQDEVVRMQEERRWIPVTDKLPCKPGTFSEKLQALTPEGHYCIVTCWISIDFPLLPKWYLDRETYHLDALMAVDVKYYMPIQPEPQEYE